MLYFICHLIATLKTVSTTYNNKSFNITKGPLKSLQKKTEFHFINPSQQNKSITTIRQSPQNYATFIQNIFSKFQVKHPGKLHPTLVSIRQKPQISFTPQHHTAQFKSSTSQARKILLFTLESSQNLLFLIIRILQGSRSENRLKGLRFELVMGEGSLLE